MRSGEPELFELLREILVGDVVEAVLGERLLLCLLAHLEHVLDPLLPAPVGEPGVRKFSLERLDVLRRQVVRGKVVGTDVVCRDAEVIG